MDTRVENPSQDIATFMASELGTLSQLAPAGAVVIGVADDRTPGNKRGCTHGPRAIREASLSILGRYTASASRTVIDLESGKKTRLKQPLSCVDLGDLLIDTTHGGDALRDLTQVVQQVMTLDAIPVLIGGHRESFRALFDAIAPAEEIAVLLLAQHLDLPARAADGPILALGTNGLQNQSHWEAVARTGTVICADKVHDEGIEAVAEACDAFVAAHKSIVCLVDMAVLDTGHAAGTPDANIGGLTAEQVLGVLEHLDWSTRLKGLAVVNLAPALDLRAQTEFIAAEVLVSILSTYLVDDVPG